MRPQDTLKQAHRHGIVLCFPDDSLVGQLTTFQLFEFHIGNKYVWIPFLEKIPFSNRQNIRKDLFG